MVLAFTQYFAKKPKLWIPCKITHILAYFLNFVVFLSKTHTKCFGCRTEHMLSGEISALPICSAFVDFYQLCVETFQFSKFQILERRKCRQELR